MSELSFLRIQVVNGNIVRKTINYREVNHEHISLHQIEQADRRRT